MDFLVVISEPWLVFQSKSSFCCDFVLISPDSAYKTHYLAWLHYSVTTGIFLFDFAWKLIHFAYSYSYMAVTGICHHIFAWSDLLRVDTNDRETMSGSMISVIILLTSRKPKNIYLFYLLHSLARFSLSILVWITLFYSV